MKILFVHITEIFQKFIMACKGICEKYVIQKPFMSSRYTAGQKRCSICDVFIKYDDIHCPCCGVMLRNNPRGTQDRTRLLLVRQQR